MPACDYKPALMKHRVTLQRITSTSDGQGGQEEAWVDHAQLWAQIQPLKGWERMQAQQLQTPITHKLLLRYRSGVTTARRLTYGARIFEIKEVININEEKRFLQVMCIETTSPGIWDNSDENWEETDSEWEQP